MSKNVFEELGFSERESKDLELKTILMDGILRTVEKHNYSSKELQTILDQAQPEISYLLNGKISRFSSDKLIKFLGLLEAEVDIKIRLPEHKIAAS